MVTVVKHPSMVRVKSIRENGLEIGTVAYNAKNYAYAHMGKFVVFSYVNGSERFHKLSSAIKFCQSAV